MEHTGIIDLLWQGPYAWPGIASQGLPNFLEDENISGRCGVYLWTVEHSGGYLIYAAGQTRRPFVKRFREHTRAYRSGVYTIFDSQSLKDGVRNKVWPGFWFKERTSEIEREYTDHAEAIRRATEDLLTAYRVFFAVLPQTPRVMERIEAAIMYQLYAAEGPASAIPDRGMALAGRWPGETPIQVRSCSHVLLHGLPSTFEA